MINTKLLSEHEIILQGLRKANTVLKRAVFASDLAEVLTDDEKQRLNEKYTKPLHEAITAVLELLIKRDLIFVKKVGKFKAYGCNEILDKNNCELPKLKVSRRQKVLKLTEAAVEKLGRAVRSSDVIEYAEQTKCNIKPYLIIRSLGSLAETGHLQKFNDNYGDDKGSNIYLPNGLNFEEYQTEKPLTWLEHVKENFLDIWAEHKQQAKDRLPFAITTAELNEQLRSQDKFKKRLREKRAVTNALKTLSEGNKAVIKKIKLKATGAVLWLPLEVADDEILLFGKDGDNSSKIAAAVKRAEQLLQRTVTSKDVKEEIRKDFSLVPSGNQTVARLLMDFSKDEIAGQNKRRKRVGKLIVYVGKVDGSAYYVSDAAKLPSAKNYLQYLIVKNKTNELFATESIETIEQCNLPTVRYGRMLQLKQSVNSLRLELLEILTSSSFNTNFRSDFENLLQNLEGTEREVTKWLNNNPQENLPETVDLSTPGWTAERLLEFYKPFYPKAQEIKNPNRLITLYERYLRRVKNKQFVSRFSEKGLNACEFLFDRTDALIHAGIKWGDNDAKFYALTAKHELGILRDIRFVLPALNSENYEERRAGIICLAFLQCEEKYDEICRIAREDKVEEVRKAAAWNNSIRCRTIEKCYSRTY